MAPLPILFSSQETHPVAGQNVCCIRERGLWRTPRRLQTKEYTTVTSKRGGLLDIFSQKHADARRRAHTRTLTHTHTLAGTTGRKGERERELCALTPAPAACLRLPSAANPPPHASTLTSSFRRKATRQAKREVGSLLAEPNSLHLHSSKGYVRGQKKKAPERGSRENLTRASHRGEREREAATRGSEQEFLDSQKAKSGAAASSSQWNGPRCHLD